MQTRLSSGQLRQQADAQSDAISALMIAAHNVADIITYGEHNKRKSGSGERFWQFREYTPSDRPQDIDWRQSAKGDSVFVRDRERQNRQNIAFWCSNAPSMTFASDKAWPPKQRAAQIITLALGVLLTKGHENIRLLNADIPSGHSENTLMQVAEHLCASRINNEQTLDTIPVLNIKNNETQIWVADFLEEPDAVLSQLQSANSAQNETLNVIIQILDPAEINLPYNGRCLFQTDADTQTVENVDAVRDAYQARMIAHMDTIKSGAAKLGWQYFCFQTDQDMSNFLFEIWAILSAARSYDEAPR